MNTSSKINRLVKIALLVAMACILMLFDFPLPIFPVFLKIDLSELPAMIGGFALGPVAGVIIVGGKVLLNTVFTGTQTGGVGELANFLVGAAYVFTAATIYKRHKTKKNAVIGLVAGTLAMTVVGAFFNYFILMPLYAKLFGGMNVIIGMSAKANGSISSLAGIVALAIVPFNIIKGVVVSLVTFATYKKVSPIIAKDAVIEIPKREPAK